MLHTLAHSDTLQRTRRSRQYTKEPETFKAYHSTASITWKQQSVSLLCRPKIERHMQTQQTKPDKQANNIKDYCCVELTHSLSQVASNQKHLHLSAALQLLQRHQPAQGPKGQPVRRPLSLSHHRALSVIARCGG